MRKVWTTSLRFRRKRQVDRDQRPPLGQFLREEIEALVGRQLGIAVADARVAEDLVQGVAVAVGVLPDVERQQVQPEDFDLPHEIADQPGPRVRHAGTAQVVGDDLQVFF